MTFVRSTQNSRSRELYPRDDSIFTAPLVSHISLTTPFSCRSILIFREIDSNKGCKDAIIVQPSKELSLAFQRATTVPISAMETTSLSNNGGPKVLVGKSLH